MNKPHSFPVTDPDLDAPDGAEVDGYRRVGDRWEHMGKKLTVKEPFAIKHSNGTYYHCWTDIGPAFGATKKDAKRFRRRKDAELEASGHWAFIDTEVVEL